MDSMFYSNGEIIKERRLQDEVWYSDYQVLLEMICRNTFENEEALLACFEGDFKETFEREITQEEHSRFKRWAGTVFKQHNKENEDVNA